jgi:hypothetical protein
MNNTDVSQSPATASGAGPAPPPVVCGSAEAVGRLAVELIANRVRAREQLRLLPRADLGPLPGVEIADAPPIDLAVLGLEVDVRDVETLLHARELLLLATGTDSAPALRAVLMDPPSPDRPVSLLRAHPRLTVLCDPAAASELPVRRDIDHVAVVLGHREPGISAEHRISVESLQRVQRAEHLVRRVPTRAVILTGYTSTGGLSEAEQMALTWRDPAVPWLLELAGRRTAENATRSLPLIQALDGIRRVTVVTSFWHVRTPYLFAPYRDRGLHLRFAFELRGGGWLRLLLDELSKLPSAPADRRLTWG